MRVLTLTPAALVGALASRAATPVMRVPCFGARLLERLSGPLALELWLGARLDNWRAGPARFPSGVVERNWAKRDCLVAMGCDAPRYTDTRQVQATCSAWRRTAAAVAFVESWLHWAEDPQLVTDAPTRGPLPDYPEFRDHRENVLAGGAAQARRAVEPEHER